MFIYPAIDIMDGQVVRLKKGAFDQVTEYACEPLTVARSFRDSGAERLHVVDLNGARSGQSTIHGILRSIAATGLFVEVGGGIRSEDQIARILETGVSRCILGTVAVRDYAFAERMIKKYGEAIAVGVDTKDGRVAVSGWAETTDLSGVDFCKRLRDSGLKTLIYTDIARDGCLEGPNIEIYRELSGIEGLDVIASGGVSSVSDVSALSRLSIHGAIIGKALYEGRVDLEDCIRAAGEAEQ